MTRACSKNDVITNYCYDFASIRKRKDKYTLGIRVYEEWDENARIRVLFSEIYIKYICLMHLINL